MSGSSGAPVRASVTIDAGADLAGLIVKAGGDPARARYEAGVLHVQGVTQEALEAAIATADPLFAQRQGKLTDAGNRLAALIEAGMPYVGRVLQIDEKSQNRMTASAAMASAGTLPSPFAWVMKDNTLLPLDAEGMIAMASAAGAYVFALRSHFWFLRNVIMAAQDAEAIQAVQTETGWPNQDAQPEQPPPEEPTPLQVRRRRTQGA